MRYTKKSRAGRSKRNPHGASSEVLRWLKGRDGKIALAGTSGVPRGSEGQEALADAIARAVERVSEALSEGESWENAAGDQAGYLSEAMYEVGMSTPSDEGGWVSDAMVNAAQRVLKALMPRNNPRRGASSRKAASYRKRW